MNSMNRREMLKLGSAGSLAVLAPGVAVTIERAAATVHSAVRRVRAG